MANKQRFSKVGFPTALRKYGRGQNVCGSKVISDFLELQPDGTTMRYLVLERAEEVKPAESKSVRKRKAAQLTGSFPAADAIKTVAAMQKNHEEEVGYEVIRAL